MYQIPRMNDELLNSTNLTEIADLLNLKLVSDKYNTSWGNKTPLGLGRVIERIYTDHIVIGLEQV